MKLVWNLNLSFLKVKSKNCIVPTVKYGGGAAMLWDILGVRSLMILFKLKVLCERKSINSTEAFSSLIIKQVKWATLVEVDPKASFSIAATPRYSRGRYSFSGLLHYPLSLPYNAVC